MRLYFMGIVIINYFKLYHLTKCKNLYKFKAYIKV